MFLVNFDQALIICRVGAHLHHCSASSSCPSSTTDTTSGSSTGGTVSPSVGGCRNGRTRCCCCEGVVGRAAELDDAAVLLDTCTPDTCQLCVQHRDLNNQQFETSIGASPCVLGVHHGVLGGRMLYLQPNSMVALPHTQLFGSCTTMHHARNSIEKGAL